MAKVIDVAAYILQKQGKMTTWKLQKMVYYSQAWFLVWEDEPLFDEEIEAWANGPVVRELYDVHKGKFNISSRTLGEGDADGLTEDQKACIDVVLKDYGDKTGQWLSELTHMEPPWREARRRCGCLSSGEHCNETVRLDEMALYYGGLLEAAVR